jgi:hypothetical protein
MKYYGFFLESACFTLAFDIMHTAPQSPEQNLMLLRLGYQSLATMLPKNHFQEQSSFQEQISVIMNAIHQILITIVPDMAVADDNLISFSQTGARTVGCDSDKYYGTTSDGHSFSGYRRTTPSSVHQQSSPTHQQQQSLPTILHVDSSTTNLDNSILTFNSLSQNLMKTPADQNIESEIADDQIINIPELDINWEDFDFYMTNLNAGGNW